jgi:hypothetical protein
VAGDVLKTLAQFAGQTVAGAAVTDVREASGGELPGCWATATSIGPRWWSGGWPGPNSVILLALAAQECLDGNAT